MNEVKPVDKLTAYKQIQKLLNTSKVGLTARQIAISLYKSGLRVSPHRQEVHPRLTELVNMGLVVECGKQYDSDTKKIVTVYREADVNEKPKI